MSISLAIHPQNNIWVEASAGSGKTKILADRMVRLLLEGTPPHRLLCLTFTKKAALEMSERLQNLLETWSDCALDQLVPCLTALLGKFPTEQNIKQARSLMSLFRTAPASIQTFHSFCHWLVSATSEGLPVRIIEEWQSLDLWRHAFQHTLKEMTEDDPLAQAALRLSKEHASLYDLLTEIFQNRLRKEMSASDRDWIPSKEPLENIMLDMALAEKNVSQLTIQDQRILENLSQMPRFSKEYCAIFITKAGKPRQSIFTHPQWHLWACAEQKNVIQFIQNQQKQDQVDLNLLFAHVFQHYVHLKEGAFDFDDLICKALDLFQSPASMGWVGCLLYQTFDHICVDEAQDTSAHQWRVLGHLMEIFIPEPHKTIFIVGDPKQSIYGFQGADLSVFYRMKSFLAQYSKEHQRSFKEVSLTTCFRSSSALLDVINHLFPDIALTQTAFPHHKAHHQGGQVELWTPQENDLLIQQWVYQIDYWLRHPFYLETQKRPLRPSDIMILLPRRTDFFLRLQEALSHLPVESDMKMGQHQVIQDLISLGQWLLYPDDESLAMLLESSLLGCTRTFLCDLAHGRGKKNLWHCLQKACDGPQAVQATEMWNQLSHWRFLLHRMNFFELFYTVVYALGGCQRIQSRLGPAVVPLIDAFLSLLYESNSRWETFLGWMENYRPPHQGPHSNSAHIQLMTIHAAKGLQAPVVIIPDLPLARKGKDANDPQEYWRLLYVAMTRAQDRLYLSCQKAARMEQGWYGALEKCLVSMGAPFERKIPSSLDHDARGVTYTGYGYGNPLDMPCPTKTLPEDISLPQWLLPLPLGKSHDCTHVNPVTDTRRTFFLETNRDDQISSEKKTSSFAWLASAYLKETGILLHQLLDELPRTVPQDWSKTIQTFLKQRGLSMRTRSLWSQKMGHLLQRADLLEIFFHGKTEVEVWGPQEQCRIDCLVQKGKEIWIVDFKSHTRPPTPWEKNVHHNTLSRYAHLIYTIYPTYRIYKGLLWLRTGDMEWIP